MTGDDNTHADRNAVVGAARDELREFVELRGEGLDGANGG